MPEEGHQPFDPSAGETAGLTPPWESAPVAADETILGRIHQAVSAGLADRVRDEGAVAMAHGVEAFGGTGNIVGVGNRIGRAWPMAGHPAPAAPPSAPVLNL